MNPKTPDSSENTIPQEENTPLTHDHILENTPSPKSYIPKGRLYALGALLFLIVSIPLGLHLIKQTQNIMNKAANGIDYNHCANSDGLQVRDGQTTASCTSWQSDNHSCEDDSVNYYYYDSCQNVLGCSYPGAIVQCLSEEQKTEDRNIGKNAVCYNEGNVAESILVDNGRCGISLSSLPASPSPSPIVDRSAQSPSTSTPTTFQTYHLGVLVIKYFPLTSDGQNIDLRVTGDVGEPYQEIRDKTISITNNLKNALEKATKYQGYSNSSAKSSLTYEIVDTKEYQKAVPFDQNSRRPLYRQIMQEHNICDYVDNKGVREVWLWAYQGPDISPGKAYLSIYESAMAGPQGDYSNSYRDTNMPVCRNTYRVYTYNYSRGTAEALHSWGHQMESELDAVDRTFFRDKFQGPNYPTTLNVVGRCGSVHNPPNAKEEYHYANQTPHQSDCLDWNPDSQGSLTNISCQNWGCQDLGDDNNPQLNYLIWNWQNLPGLNNTKTYQGKRLRNWWDVHGDFDNVMTKSRRLIQ